MKAILAVLACLLVLGCGQKATRLPHGYQYVPLDGHSSAIADGNGTVVVDPDVFRYVVSSNYVIGERRDAKIDPQNSTKFGFFVLNLKTGQLIEGLDSIQLKHLLLARGLDKNTFTMQIQ